MVSKIDIHCEADLGGRALCNTQSSVPSAPRVSREGFAFLMASQRSNDLCCRCRAHVNRLSQLEVHGISLDLDLVQTALPLSIDPEGGPTWEKFGSGNWPFSASDTPTSVAQPAAGPDAVPPNQIPTVSSSAAPSILHWSIITHDLVCTLGQLIREARRYPRERAVLPMERNLAIAAVAFTIQLAIEAGRDSSALRALECELLVIVETMHPADV